MEYYRQSSADTLHALDSTPDGLTQAQADERLARDGHNVLAEPPKPSVVKRFFAQLADPMILVLLAAALINSQPTAAGVSASDAASASKGTTRLQAGHDLTLGTVSEASSNHLV